MANEKNNIDDNSNVQFKKPNFFKKVWYSITKFEKYPEMSAEGFTRALKYMCQIMAIFSLVVTVSTTIQLYQLIQNGVNFLENDIPEFSYKDGILTIDKKELIEIDNNILGKIIIDTNIDKQENINEYINKISEEEGIIILKDKLILKNLISQGEITYNYKELLESSGGNITEFNKIDIINFARGNQILIVYLMIATIIFVYTWILYILSILTDSLILAVLGWITALVAKIRMKFVAIYNMAVYALTLSIVLNIVYFVVYMFTGFKITYFQVMYTSVAYIYLVAAIFIIKSEFIKKQAELMNIIEEQDKVQDYNQEENIDNDNKDDKKDENKNENDDNKDKKQDQDPEGSSA